MDVNEYLDEAVEMLVLLHKGEFQLSCSVCTPDIQQDFNCAYTKDYNSESDQSAFFCEYNMKEYCACPLSMIPKVIWDLYDDYRYINDMNKSPDKTECPSMLWWFFKEYKYQTIKYDNYQIEARQRKDSVNK